VKEALKIYEKHRNVIGQARAWRRLGWLLYDDKQFDAAEEAASKAIDISSGDGDQFEACKCLRLLGDICRSKSEIEKAINHYEAALCIASSFGWVDSLFWNNYCLAELFFDQNRFDEAHAHVERAKSYAINNPSQLGQAMELQAAFCYE
jgi:tetratricopeptide (TPR) repeat protein